MNKNYIKKKIYGLVWGATLGDTLGKKYEGHTTYNNVYDLNSYEIDFENDKDNDWTDDTDMLVLVMENLYDYDYRININELSLAFKYWQKNGFKELGDTYPYGIGSQINFILSQTNYTENPIKSSKKSYRMMSFETAGNGALMRNAICGITKKWSNNTIKQCIITNYDTRCIASCLVQSYIINCIFYKIKINWDYIFKVCLCIIKSGYKKNRNTIEFEKYWHLGLNYENLVKNYNNMHDITLENLNEKETCFLNFLKKLNIGNYELNGQQSYTLLGMTLCIAIILDINYYIKINKKHPDVFYYMAKIKEVISVGGDTDTNACIIGSIIGVYIGVDNLPKEWINKTKHMEWLNIKINNFIKNF